MNRTQIAALYDSFSPEQQNMPRSEFIKKAMNTLDPAKNSQILDAMVQRKRQATQGQIEQARIDTALQRGKK